jgi:hypothetical protein
LTEAPFIDGALDPGRNTMRLRHAAIALSLSLAIGIPDAVLAHTYACAVPDPAGDPVLSPGQGFDGAAYQDIQETSIERSAGAIVFSMKVSAPIPSAPRLKTPNGLLLWMWGMNTGPGVARGFPLSPGLTGLLEFWIHLAWDGEDFSAAVIDRRPGVQGDEPVVTAAAFVIDGTTIKVIAPTALFDDPAEFRWGSSTWIWSTHLGNAAAHVVDRAPDGPASTCTAD